VARGSGIEIRCEDPRVPTDQTNTCYKIVERAMAALKAKGRVVIEIEKRLPVQGGLGGASANAVATLLALERLLKKRLPNGERLRIAAEVGSDLPLFLIGGTVLGIGRGEDVYPVPDLPSCPCVIATPEIGVSTPQAFADWDRIREVRASSPVQAEQSSAAWPGIAEQDRTSTGEDARRSHSRPKLTPATPSDRMNGFGRRLSAWLSGSSGVPARSRGRAETLLLDLVQTGIANDFEQVVFPKHPELSEVKRVLERAGAFYASLSGSGSAVYGLFRTREAAQKAATRLEKQGIPATATTTLTRAQYWKRI
jgi:4-diphosphocytidyl-2-C-methyl-D-erythritol kinase